MQALTILEPREGAPSDCPVFFETARPSRELLGRLANDATAACKAGRIDDACILLGVALALRRAQVTP
jgi:hypothetical protein